MNNELAEEFYEDTDAYVFVINLRYEWFGCISVKEYKSKSVWSALASVSVNR